MKQLKVFKMNECDWVIAESMRQAKLWYAKECGFSRFDMDDAYECIAEEGEDSGYWREVNSPDSYFKEPKEGKFHVWNGMFCQWVKFKDAVKDWSGDVPMVIASTEF